MPERICGTCGKPTKGGIPDTKLNCIICFDCDEKSHPERPWDGKRPTKAIEDYKEYAGTSYIDDYMNGDDLKDIWRWIDELELRVQQLEDANECQAYTIRSVRIAVTEMPPYSGEHRIGKPPEEPEDGTRSNIMSEPRRAPCNTNQEPLTEEPGVPPIITEEDAVRWDREHPDNPLNKGAPAEDLKHIKKM